MAFEGWEGYIPPITWDRVLAMDVGGATNNALEWGAICPDTNSVVIYWELVKTTTDIRLLASLAKPFLCHPDGQEYNFRFKVGDYENRIALDDMGRHGVKFQNAVKHDKNLSIQRMAQYLHPNPMRPFPSWHPKAGQLGAPLMFIAPNCVQLLREIPNQKWKTNEGGVLKDEMDRSIRHDTVDCILYICRMLPAPAAIPVPKRIVLEKKGSNSIMSKLYWYDVKKAEENLKTPERRPYNPAHQGGDLGWKL